MKLSLIFLSTVFFTVQARTLLPSGNNNADGKPRIISGQKAVKGQFPWQAALNLRTPIGMSFCGGSLISPKWVLTAAHCVDGILSFQVTLGITNLYDFNNPDRYTTTSYHAFHHDNYNEMVNNDIALIELPEEVPLSDAIQLMRLPSRSEVNDPLTNIKVTISGWGKTSDASSVVSDDLNYVELDTISNEECIKYHNASSVISSTICALGHPEHSPCNGDSGGPLIRIAPDGKPTQVGIASFVHDDGCASGNPSAYVRTASFLDWIHEHTGIPIRD